jgi:adenylate cyclase
MSSLIKASDGFLSEEQAGYLKRRFIRCAKRWPFTCLFGLAVFSNIAASLFSIGYNHQLIVSGLNPDQKQAFWKIVIGNNLVMFSICMGLMVLLFQQLYLCRRDIVAGQRVSRERLVSCQRLLINLPFWQLCINLLGWLPGTVVFPLGICLLANWQDAEMIWTGFAASFLVSAFMATVLTFFLMEAFELRFLFEDFFPNDRPAETPGAIRIPLRHRFLFYWFGVAVVPLLGLLSVTLHPSAGSNPGLAVLIALLALVNSAILGAVTGRTMLGWVESQAKGTDEIALGNFNYRIPLKRPGDLGKLTDRFNDMAEALRQGRHVRDTFGQFVSPELLDNILQGEILGGKVQEITVLFADIRGFTRRTAGQDPKKVVDLLNRFLTLSVAAVEENGGWVNKFLGDGIMGLFGAPLLTADHADLAVAAGCDLLARLDQLNLELTQEGQPPLQVGIGLNSGPALVGSIGATVHLPNGQTRTRREFTAIGETVNLAQRIEQLTKVCTGPVLLSGETFRRLKHPVATIDRGPQQVPGAEKPLLIHCIEFATHRPAQVPKLPSSDRSSAC